MFKYRLPGVVLSLSLILVGLHPVAWSLERPEVSSAPALEVAYVTQFALEWRDVGSGGDYDGAYYVPAVPAGYHALGHYGQGNYSNPSAGVLAARALEPDALAPPIDYLMVWGDYGSGADWDGSFWSPIPPSGYVCLGLVAQRGYEKPSTGEIRCVRQDLVTPGRIGNAVWIDVGTGADRDFGSWYVVPADENGLQTGTFVGHASHSLPAWPVFVLDARSVRRAAPSQALELAYTARFELEWWDKGSGGDLDGAYFKPVVPDGFYALGHYGQGTYAAPRGFMFVARELEPGALAPPRGYVKIWGDHGSGADLNGSFWKPVPQDGYLCLGLVAQRGYEQPSTDEIRCVRQDLTAPGRLGNRIWIDVGTGADADFGSWYTVPADGNGIYVGAFTGHASHTPIPDLTFVLDKRAVNATDIWPMPATIEKSEEEKLSYLQNHAPRVWLANSEHDHSEGEIYYPSSVEWAFEHLVRVWRRTIVFPTTLRDDWWLVTREGLGSPSDVLPFFHGCDGHSTADVCSLDDTPVYAFWDEVDTNLWGDPVEVADLIYFFYYPYNRGKELASTMWGNHVGDWEHVTVRLAWQWDAQAGWTLEPHRIYLPAHATGRSYSWHEVPKMTGDLFYLPLVARGQSSTAPASGPSSTSAGRHRLDTHPIVYAAWGSHGMWRDPGIHEYEPLLFDYTGPGTAWDTWDLIRTFDYETRSGLGDSEWPVWMSVDYDDPNIGDADPASGPVWRWGNPQDGCVFGQCRLSDGPTGPVDKNVWDNEVLQ